MKKLEQNKIQKNNHLWIWIVIVVLVVGLLGFYLWTSYGTENQVEKIAASPSTIVASVEEVIMDEQVQLTNFPFVKTVNLEMGRYDVSFEADKNLRMTLYNEARYNEWVNSETHTLSKISTQKGSECCAVSGNYRIDINEGEAGTYYFVFEDVRSLGASSSKLVVNKIGEMGR